VWDVRSRDPKRGIIYVRGSPKNKSKFDKC
jgi:hypothetical protein